MKREESLRPSGAPENTNSGMNYDIRTPEAATESADETSHLAEAARDYRFAAETAWEAEKRFHAFLDNVDDMVYFRGVDATVATLNAACRRVTGYPRTAFIQNPHLWRQLVHVEDLARMQECMDEATEESDALTVEYRLRRKDGVWCWIQSRMVASRDEAGTVTGYNCIDRDVTAWKRAEKALRKREAELVRAQRLARLGNWHFDAARRTFWWSDEMFRIFGLERTKQAPALRHVRDMVSREDRHRLAFALRRALKEGKGFSIELTILRRGGEKRAIMMLCEALHGPDHQIEALAGSVQDVTEQRVAEEERRSFERQLQQAQKLESLGVLAGGLAHDFNNLLMSVLGNADLARMQLPEDASARMLLDEVMDGARRAADLASQMLAYSGKGRFVIESVDLRAAVREMGHLLEASISKKAALVYDFPATLPFIEADVTQIRQIIMNLITNASEALNDAEGVITLRLDSRHYDAAELDCRYLFGPWPSGTYVSLRVSDAGCGMDEETLERLFDPFFTTKLTGRGLGLATVLGSTKAHGGLLRVDTAPGKGTAFEILLPAKDVASEAAETRKDACRFWSGGGAALLVEDEANVRAVAQRMLEHLGMTVTVAEDGVQAMTLFEPDPTAFDCVVLDWSMPKLDGRATLQRLRCINPHVPVIVCSGYSEDMISAQIAGPPPAAFVQKPFRLASLEAALKAAIAGQSHENLFGKRP